MPRVDGVLVEVLRGALPGVSVWTRPPADLASRPLPAVVARQVAGGTVGVVSSVATGVTVQLDIYGPSVEAAYGAAAGAAVALIDAARMGRRTTAGQLCSCSAQLPVDGAGAGVPDGLHRWIVTATVSCRGLT